VIAQDLNQVPEVQVEPTLTKNAAGFQAGQIVGGLIGRIKSRNVKETDGFIEDLMGQRREMSGMPFAMGDACRLKGERSREFPVAAAVVRTTLQRASSTGDRSQARLADRDRAEKFWKDYRSANVKEGRTAEDHAASARVAALMQVLAPEVPALRLGLVRYLEEIKHPEASKALARLAIFSTEADVRQAALKALKPRKDREITDVLVSGLKYPWPAVADRAADAMVQLGRKDLLPQLVEQLDAVDPRAPVMTEINKKKVPVVREMVRVNHNRNCLLCHSPGTGGEQFFGLGLITAPIPSDPPDSPSDGYRGTPSFPDNLVRIDVTYLRQDFSLTQSVKNSQPWPEMQRFDFLVRTRQLTEAEAKEFRTLLAKQQKDQMTPYQKAALTALRGLTGKDAKPTAEAWRKMLDL
jgi:hypothetical protein